MQTLPPDMKFSVALVEDNRISRNSFLLKTEVFREMKLVFDAANGHQCLEQLKSLPNHLLPQVIFVDLEMPQMDGIQTISIAKSLYPQIHFIVLTMFDDDDKIFEAIRAGASGYLLKHEPSNVLKEAIISVLEYGGAPMSPAVARKAMNLLSKSPLPPSAPPSTPLPEGISDREHEVLQMMVSGWDAKRIASSLNLSVLTVRKHIANIYGKLHVNSKAQVISLAHKKGWM